MSSKTLFTDVQFASEDGAYEFYLKSPHRDDLRALVNQMYQEVGAFIGDDNFPKMLQTDFHAALWQLYVTWTFFKQGKSKPVAAAGHGPDVVLEDGTIIEAVLVKRGNGPDRPFDWSDVTPYSDKNGVKIYGGHALNYPDPQVMIRISSAISSKIKQHQKWLTAGVVGEDQPFIIAVNAGAIEFADCQFGEPCYAARVAFAIGADKIVVPVNMVGPGLIEKEARMEIDHLPKVEKHSKAEVPSNIFLDDSHKQLSGLLFSGTNFPTMMLHGHFSDLHFVQNGFAKNPVSRELIENIRQWWIEFVEGAKTSYVLKTSPELTRAEE